MKRVEKAGRIFDPKSLHVFGNRMKINKITFLIVKVKATYRNFKEKHFQRKSLCIQRYATFFFYIVLPCSTLYGSDMGGFSSHLVCVGAGTDLFVVEWGQLPPLSNFFTE